MDDKTKIIEEISEINAINKLLKKILEATKGKDVKMNLMYWDSKIQDMSKEILIKMMKDEIKEQKIEEIIKAHETFFNVMKAILGDDTNE